MRAVKFTYTLIGLLIGSFFPLAALVLLFFFRDNALYLFYIICTAPIILTIGGFNLGKRQDRLTRTSLGLEELIEERTQSVRSLLDVSGQGFFTFDNKFHVQPEYSRECEKIFGKPIAGLEVQYLLFTDPQHQEEFVQGFSLYFEGKARGDVILGLVETESIINHRFMNIEYRILNDTQVLVSLKDLTADRTLEERIRVENEKRSIILKAVSHKNYFSSFIREADELFDHMTLYEKHRPSVQELQDLMRLIHTFKGNAGFFGFTMTQEVAHDFEYHISDSLAMEEEVEFFELSIDLKKAYYGELEIIIETLGKAWMDDLDGIIVPRRAYMKIEHFVKKNYPHEKRLYRLLEHYRKVEVRQLFSRFPDIAENLAGRLGKRLKPIRLTGGEFLILPDKFEDMISSLIHIIRNMVDHGIETVQEREFLKKDPAGQISIDIRKQDDAMFFLFTDDGGGISIRSIERRAKENKLINEDDKLPEHKLLDLIFHPEFSTSDVVNDVSGRGIGLSAVKQEVEKLGGKVAASTRLNRGSAFEIMVPLSKRHEETGI